MTPADLHHSDNDPYRQLLTDQETALAERQGQT